MCVSRQNSNTRPPPLDFLSLSLSLVQAMNVVKRLAHAVAVWLVLHALGAGLERGETGGAWVGLGRAWDWPPPSFSPSIRGRGPRPPVRWSRAKDGAAWGEGRERDNGHPPSHALPSRAGGALSPGRPPPPLPPSLFCFSPLFLLSPRTPAGTWYRPACTSPPASAWGTPRRPTLRGGVRWG